MGPTKVFRAQHTDPDSIRGALGLTDTRNTVHGSGRPDRASVLDGERVPTFGSRVSPFPPNCSFYGKVSLTKK